MCVEVASLCAKAVTLRTKAATVCATATTMCAMCAKAATRGARAATMCAKTATRGEALAKFTGYRKFSEPEAVPAFAARLLYAPPLASNCARPAAALRDV